MLDYKTWGADGIDEATHEQMRVAVYNLPVVVAAALMADAHVGYGVPIGSVLAFKDAVCPSAVGVDIACGMRMSIYDLWPEQLTTRFSAFRNALQDHTYFGVGAENDEGYSHRVMKSSLWDSIPVLNQYRQTATMQLGTSGGGNHFAEFGVLCLPTGNLFGLPGRRYVALLTHGGSRRVGLEVCNRYTAIARQQHPEYGDLAWLDMDSAVGREYWAAMSLMGRYSEANHELIHSSISHAIGAEPLAGVANRHNSARWEALPDGTPVVVHRKGATPAGKGILGIIPGSMGTPAYVVRGLGNPESLNSASHGAGRRLSRAQARKTLNYAQGWLELLEKKDIVVLGGDVDELPEAYKDIDTVMAAQADLVEKVAKFEPRIVMMAGQPGEV
jgi:tRNA-splicing ligase RtcB